MRWAFPPRLGPTWPVLNSYRFSTRIDLIRVILWTREKKQEPVKMEGSDTRHY
jgi:hypothetical protein